MKKIYLLAFASFLVCHFQAQTITAKKKEFTKLQLSPYTIVPRQELPDHASVLRDVIFSEDFEDVEGTLPAVLPAGWSAPTVTSIVDSNDEPDEPIVDVVSFKIENAETAVAGGYWPVPELGANNKFAGANDDSDPCDCDDMDIWLQSPEMDFSSAINPALIFDIFHDMSFGGGDAIVQLSVDGGTNWTDLVYTGTTDGTLPADETVWQTVIYLLFDYAGESSVTFRFHWSDDASWASGFAVDNIEVGDLDEYNLKADKVLPGNWYQDEFAEGFWDYTMIPIDQVSEIAATGVISNNGLNAQTAVTFNLEVLFNNSSMGNWPSLQSTDLASLTKDTLSVVTDYTPSDIGMVTLECSAVSTVQDDNPADDMASKEIEITACTYARDADNAQAFTFVANDEIWGNLFGIHSNDAYGGIDVAIGASSDLGAVIQGELFIFDGLDDDGLPLLSEVDDSFTVQHTVTAEDGNIVGENIFVTLPFEDGAIELEAGVTYLAAITNIGNGDVRIPVSGPNYWPASWFLSEGEWGWTGNIPMVRLNCDETIAISNVVGEATCSLQQNIPNPASETTLINYSVQSYEKVSLLVRDMTGRIVLANDLGKQTPGAHGYSLNVTDLSSGIYTYTLFAGEMSFTQKMMVE